MLQPRLRALACLGLLTCTACSDCGKSSGGSPTVSAQDLAATKAKVESLETARKAALAAAKETIVARSDLGPCPVDVGELGPPSTKDLSGSKTAWGGYNVSRWSPNGGNDFLASFPDTLCAIERLGIAYADEVGTKPGPPHTPSPTHAQSRSAEHHRPPKPDRLLRRCSTVRTERHAGAARSAPSTHGATSGATSPSTPGIQPPGGTRPVAGS